MNAQLTNKKGAQILAESGDWAISVKVDLFISFATNLVPGFAGVSEGCCVAFNQYQEDQISVFKSKAGLAFGLGARGFLGAEYFFAPKMSVGGEFAYGLSGIHAMCW